MAKQINLSKSMEANKWQRIKSMEANQMQNKSNAKQIKGKAIQWQRIKSLEANMEAKIENECLPPSRSQFLYWKCHSLDRPAQNK